MPEFEQEVSVYVGETEIGEVYVGQVDVGDVERDVTMSIDVDDFLNECDEDERVEAAEWLGHEYFDTVFHEWLAREQGSMNDLFDRMFANLDFRWVEPERNEDGTPLASINDTQLALLHSRFMHWLNGQFTDADLESGILDGTANVTVVIRDAPIQAPLQDILNATRDTPPESSEPPTPLPANDFLRFAATLTNMSREEFNALPAEMTSTIRQLVSNQESGAVNELRLIINGLNPEEEVDSSLVREMQLLAST